MLSQPVSAFRVSRSLSLRVSATTLAPSSLRSFTVARPIPLPAPVTKTRCPALNRAVIAKPGADLAYTIAKAQDPGGRISKDDIIRAGEVVGMSLMDPNSAVQVLSNLKNSLVEAQGIRETETRRQYPSLRAWGGVPNAAGAPSAPVPQGGGAPEAPAPVEEWTRDPATGKPVRVR